MEIMEILRLDGHIPAKKLINYNSAPQKRFCGAENI